MRKQGTLETIWEVPDELWERIESVMLEEDPPKARGRKPPILGRCSMASSFACAAGANGTNSPKSLGTTVPSIALSSGG